MLDSHNFPDAPIYFSSVVGHELYVGAAAQAQRREVDTLWNRFNAVGRLVVPNDTDWQTAGRVLQEVGSQQGYGLIGRARLTNDALLAMSAWRLGFTVVTLNAADFQLLASYRRFSWRTLGELT